MNKKNINKKGFTLIELLLYVGVTGFILTAVVMFMATLLQVQAKNRTISEVNQQGALVLQAITQTIRNSTDVNSPATGANATSLSVGVTDALKNPTIFSVSAGAFRVSEGASSYILTNSKVTAVNTVFTNLSRADTPGIIKIEFTLASVNSTNRNEFDYNKTFSATASLR